MVHQDSCVLGNGFLVLWLSAPPPELCSAALTKLQRASRRDLRPGEGDVGSRDSRAGICRINRQLPCSDRSKKEPTSKMISSSKMNYVFENQYLLCSCPHWCH
ncbi:unnamed protein product, partial [Musa acuminata var. zebrina]